MYVFLRLREKVFLRIKQCGMSKGKVAIDDLLSKASADTSLAALPS